MFMDTRINKYLLSLFWLLLLVLLIKLMWVIASYFLPLSGIDKMTTATKHVKKTYPIQQLFTHKTTLPHTAAANTKKIASLGGVRLLALYVDKETGGGYIAMMDKKSNSYFLQAGDKYQSYVLKTISKNEAVFEYNEKLFHLVMEESMQSLGDLMDVMNAPARTVRLKRKELSYYTNNLKNVWENIGIVEVYKENKIDGFKITSINKQSIFYAKLALRKNDIIKQVDGKNITSYQDALALYSGLSEKDYISIAVLREGKTVELSYEIY